MSSFQFTLNNLPHDTCLRQTIPSGSHDFKLPATGIDNNSKDFKISISSNTTGESAAATFDKVSGVGLSDVMINLREKTPNRNTTVDISFNLMEPLRTAPGDSATIYIKLPDFTKDSQSTSGLHAIGDFAHGHAVSE